MSDPVQAWAFVCSLIGTGWTLVMIVGLIGTPRTFMKARFLLGTFALLGAALAVVGFLGLTM